MNVNNVKNRGRPQRYEEVHQLRLALHVPIVTEELFLLSKWGRNRINYAYSVPSSFSRTNKWITNRRVVLTKMKYTF